MAELLIEDVMSTIEFLFDEFASMTEILLETGDSLANFLCNATTFAAGF